MGKKTPNREVYGTTPWAGYLLSILLGLSFVCAGFGLGGLSTAEGFIGGLLILLGAAWLCLVVGIWQHNRTYRSKRHFEREIQDMRAAHQREIRDLTSAKIEVIEKARMARWFRSLAKSPWQANAREVEIEAKFVFPLLKYLGYEESEMELRAPVTLQEGSRETKLEADWVLRSDAGGALVVVEAKAPSQPLTENVRKQARSYAFRLEAPVYIITNGKELQIFHRGVLKDRCFLSCSTRQIGESWEAIQQAAGKSSVMSLKEQLSG